MTEQYRFNQKKYEALQNKVRDGLKETFAEQLNEPKVKK